MGPAWVNRLRLVLLAYTCVMVYFTHLPPEDLSPPPFFGFDKLVHFCGYGMWGGLAGLVARGRFAWGWLGLGLCLAAADEMTQPLVRRTAELADWVADGVGVGVGLAVAGVVYRFFWSTSSEKD